LVSHIEGETEVEGFENGMLRKTVGSRRDEVTGAWRRLRNEEHYGLHSSTHTIRMIKAGTVGWARHAALMGVRRGAYRVLVGRTEGKRPLGRPRCR
jgi:hypothetical protein